jgi:predicted Zn-dependent protease
MAPLNRHSLLASTAGMALGLIMLLGAAPASAAQTNLGRALGLVDREVECSISPDLDLDQRCRAEDFDLSKPPLADKLGMRLQLQLKKGGARWVRRSTVRFYAEAIGPAVTPQPKSNGTQISTPRAPIGATGSFLRRLDGKTIDQRPGGRLFTLSPTEAAQLMAYRQLRLELPDEEARLTALLAQLDLSWPYGRASTPRVVIIASGDYTAAAMPDDVIAVPLGLLSAAKSDDELAFVLAHELAHYRLGHFATDLARERRLAQANPWATAAIGGALLGAVLSDKKSTRYALVGAALGAMISMQVYSRPQWSKPKEGEADMLAFDLVKVAGYCPVYGATSVFRNLEDEEVRSQAVAASHEKRPQSDQDAYLATVHDRARDRTTKLDNYALGLDPAPACQPRTETTDALSASGNIARARTVLSALARVSTADQAADQRAKLAAVKPILSGPFKSTPAIINAAASAYAALGQPDKALELYGSVPVSDQSSLALVEHARLLVSAENYAEARRLLEAVAKRRDAPSSSPRLRVSLDLKAGDVTEVAKSLPACLDVDDKAVRQQCGEAYLSARDRLATSARVEDLTPLDALVKKRAPEARAAAAAP